MRRMILLATIAAVATVSAVVQGQAPVQVQVQEKSAPASAAAAAANGKILFTKDGCYECHGYAAQGSRAGARIAAFPGSAQVLIAYVRRPTGEMPAYTDKIVPDKDLEDIYAYLQSLPAPKPAKDIPLLNKAKNRE